MSQGDKLQGNDLVNYVTGVTKEYPIDINIDEAYLIKTGNVSYGGRVPDFLVTKADLEFYANLVTKIITEGEKYDGGPLEKVSKFLQDAVPLIHAMFNTVQMNEKWSEFDRWVREYKEKCYGDKIKYCESDPCFTNLSVVPFFLGDCREHEVVLHFMLKFFLRQTSTDDVQVRSLYAKYRYPSSQGDIPDYDHTHPVLIFDNKVYNVDALDYKYTSYETKQWTPLVVTRYDGSKGKVSHRLDWNEGMVVDGDNKHVYGSPTEFSGTANVPMPTPPDHLCFYSKKCDPDAIYDVEDLRQKLIDGVFWKEKIKRLENKCLAEADFSGGGRARGKAPGASKAAKSQAAKSQAAKSKGAKSQAAKSQAAKSRAAKSQAAKSQAAKSQAAGPSKYVRTSRKDGSGRVIYVRGAASSAAGAAGGAEYVRRKDKSGALVYRRARPG
jgi:hypothetical protein